MLRCTGGNNRNIELTWQINVLSTGQKIEDELQNENDKYGSFTVILL